jgi:hypothetical protein
MSEFISELQTLLSVGCTAHEDEDMIFLLLNSHTLEYHRFTTSNTDVEPLTFKVVSLILILQHEKPAGVKPASSRRGGITFYAKIKKPSQGFYTQRLGNRSNDGYRYCQHEDH